MRCEERLRQQTLQPYRHKTHAGRGSRLRFALLLARSILTGRLFGTSALNIHYKSICIGRYAVSAALRHPAAYLDRKIYYRRLIEALRSCVAYVDNFLAVWENVAACYVNDPAYANGVYCELAAYYKIPLYMNFYPHRLTRFRIEGGAGAVEPLVVHPASSEGRKEKGREILERITDSTEEIEYMATIEFEMKDFDPADADVVIYAHSFTDAQQSYGGDPAFLSMYDWLVFTLDALRDKKVILKAHPGFYRKGYVAQVIEWDRRVFDEVVKKFSGRKNLAIIDWPMRNNELLARIRKSCILVSHHSNALIEGAGKGFRCISSAAASWQKYALFNAWSTRREYEALLKNHELLVATDLGLLYEYVHDLYEGPNSFFHKDSWRHIVAREANIPASEISRDGGILSSLPEQRVEHLIDLVSRKIPTIEFR